MEKESFLRKGCRRHAGTWVVLTAWCDIACGGSVGRNHCRYRNGPPRDRERGVADADAAGAETIGADRGGGLRQIRKPPGDQFLQGSRRAGEACLPER